MSRVTSSISSRAVWVFVLCASIAGLSALAGNTAAAQDAEKKAEFDALLKALESELAGIGAVTKLAAAMDENETPASASNTEAAARSEFSALVLADMPPPLSLAFDDLARRVSAITSVAFEPEWWQLNMACFRAAAPFRGAEIADKLGMVVVSDLADELIVAPRLTPEAKQAEARMFLIGLVGGDQGPKMWDGIATWTPPGQNRDFRVRSVVNVAGIGNRVVWEEAMGGSDERAKLRSSDETNVFGMQGDLSDPKVQATLGLSAEALARPMRHYSLASFKVGPYQPTDEESGNTVMYKRRYYNQPQQPEGSLAIWAETGHQRSPIPEGPQMGEGIDLDSIGSQLIYAMFGQFGMNAMRMFGRDSGYSSYGSSSSGRNSGQPAESAQYVCMLLKDFKIAAKADREQAIAAAQALDALRKADAGAEKIAEAVKALHLSYARNSRPQQITWCDRTAIALRRDPEDRRIPAMHARDSIRTRAVEGITAYYKRKGNLDSMREGLVNDWQVLQEIGFNYGLFNVRPYQAHQIEIRKDTDPAYSGYVLLRTVEHVAQELAFSIRIEPGSGHSTWLLGEPESMDVIRARRLEVYEGTKKLVELVKKAGIGGTAIDYSRHWIQQQFSGSGMEWKYSSSLDFEVTRLLPGLVRVKGQGISTATDQSAIVDVTTGKVLWETIAPAATEDAPMPLDMNEAFWE